MKNISIKTKLLLLVILSIFVVSLVLIISSILSINYISDSNINKYEKEIETKFSALEVSQTKLDDMNKEFEKRMNEV